jgi:hypothetical protein
MTTPSEVRLLAEALHPSDPASKGPLEYIVEDAYEAATEYAGDPSDGITMTSMRDMSAFIAPRVAAAILATGLHVVSAELIAVIKSEAYNRALDELVIPANNAPRCTVEERATLDALARLPEGSAVQRYLRYWRVTVPVGDPRLAVIATGDTIAAAIDAAMEEKEKK